MFRFLALITVVAAVFFAATQLTAKDAPEGWVQYTPEALAAAQASGDPVVVDVFAPWCPTCRAQAPILDELRLDDRLADATFIKVNFDENKAFLRAHRIPRQSTILVFKGRTEVARSIAETNRMRLRAVVLNAL
ncbi:MAG: thioredoxin family protein [Altererythrobacter sp.]|nr:thioredoxin family protein [Altererythrobacter sp.]NNE50007.1 thioredoxin family protein [Altererythrobacter sp.]